jgi:hypothetical protein
MAIGTKTGTQDKSLRLKMALQAVAKFDLHKRGDPHLAAAVEAVGNKPASVRNLPSMRAVAIPRLVLITQGRFNSAATWTD